MTTQLLEGSGKRLHLLNRMFDAGGELLATAEHLLIHVSLATRRATPPGAELQQRLAELQSRHAALPRPVQLHCGQRDRSG